jgi:2-C-methyl-D-erythritol 2,4-cyclodiphosphate synthase
MYRIGIGYDQHEFIENKKLVLGGIPLKYNKGLKAHSDGDALIHALCDGLLGALGRGDIGEWFPDTDEQFKDMDSSLFLRQIMNMVTRDGYKVVNADCILILDEPKISSYKKEMKERLAGLLDVPISSLNIKATRTEGIGQLTDSRGIAAQAIILLKKFDQ